MTDYEEYEIKPEYCPFCNKRKVTDSILLEYCLKTFNTSYDKLRDEYLGE